MRRTAVVARLVDKRTQRAAMKPEDSLRGRSRRSRRRRRRLWVPCSTSARIPGCANRPLSAAFAHNGRADPVARVVTARHTRALGAKLAANAGGSLLESSTHARPNRTYRRSAEDHAEEARKYPKPKLKDPGAVRHRRPARASAPAPSYRLRYATRSTARRGRAAGQRHRHIEGDAERAPVVATGRVEARQRHTAGGRGDRLERPDRDADRQPEQFHSGPRIDDRAHRLRPAASSA